MLTISERLLGSEHPDVISTFTKIDSLNRIQGRYRGVESLYLRAVEANERAGNLAFLDTAQGRHVELRRFFVRAGGRRAGARRDAPNTLIIIDLLPLDASVLRLVSVRDGWRDGDEAEPIYG